MSTNRLAKIEKCKECGKSHFMVGDDPHNRTRHYPYIPNPKRRQRDELDKILTLINYRKIKTKDAKVKLLALSESRAIGAKIAELREAWKVKGLTYHPYIKARIETLEKELKERNEHN